MDPLELLASLESLREKIPGALRQDFEDLIASIRNTYEMSIKFVTPPEPVHEGRRNLAAHHTTLDGLCTQLESSLEAFQQVYVGQGSDAYHTRASASLQDLKTMREHLAHAAVLHTTMATNFDTATEAKVALAALLVGLGITLGVLIASAGSTAPVTVPAAAFEVAGGAVSIGVLTEAEAAATAAIMGLIWAGLPDALLAGLEGFAATEVLGHIALHPPTTVTLPTTHPNVPTNSGPNITINEVHAHTGDLPTNLAKTPSGGRVYIPPKVKGGKGEPVWGKIDKVEGFIDDRGNVWVWAEDKHAGDHWDVQHKIPGSKKWSHTNVAPDGKVIGGPAKDLFPSDHNLKK
ncbi:MAG: hypothetical protein JO215_03380 [Ktedonobacteraceae bacterium]|nr:hypothetical protein [Ktedonobacteraceae bacterium]